MQVYGKEHSKGFPIVHTNQSSQFTSGNFQTLLLIHESILSVSKKGTPYDNALMESFYRTIKSNLIQDTNSATPEKEHEEIFKYIELYYTAQRMHSSFGYLSTSQIEG